MASSRALLTADETRWSKPPSTPRRSSPRSRLSLCSERSGSYFTRGTTRTSSRFKRSALALTGGPGQHGWCVHARVQCGREPGVHSGVEQRYAPDAGTMLLTPKGWRNISLRVAFDRADFDLVPPGSQDIPSAFVASRKKQKPEFRPLGPKL